MSGMGESDALDFSFEDLEFIEGDVNDLGEGATADPNQMSAEEIKEKEDADAAAAEAEAKAAAMGKTPEEIEEEERIAAEAAEEAAEGKSPENVSGKSTEDGDGEGKETSPELYQALTNVLKEKGVLSSVEESSLKEVKDVDSLVALLQKQIKAEEYSDLTDTQKTILKDMREGVSEDTAAQFKNSMDNLNALDDSKIAEDKQVRFDLIYQDFLAKGFAKDKAVKFANRSFDLKEDEADAKEAKLSLVKAVTDRYNRLKDKEVSTQASKIKAIEDNKIALKDKILKSKEAIKGFEIPDNVRKEVYEDMVKTVSNNPDTGVPENALMKFQRESPLEYSHKLYYLFKVTNGFEDMDYFKGKKTSNSTRALETALRQSSHVSGGGDPSFADDKDAHSLDIGDLVLPGE